MARRACPVLRGYHQQADERPVQKHPSTICCATDGRRVRADLAQRLIRCPSVTPAEGGALDLLEAELSAIGFACTRLRRLARAAPGSTICSRAMVIRLICVLPDTPMLCR